MTSFLDVGDDGLSIILIKALLLAAPGEMDLLGGRGSRRDLILAAAGEAVRLGGRGSRTALLLALGAFKKKISRCSYQ